MSTKQPLWSPAMIHELESLNDAIISATKRSGVSCKFVQLNAKWGIKIYSNGKVRDNAYDKQKKLAELGFAPPVGDRVIWYSKPAYITRIAKPLVDVKYFDENDDEWEAAKDEWQERIDRLNNLLKEEYNLGTIDNHVGNYGIYKGFLVVIDTEDANPWGLSR